MKFYYGVDPSQKREKLLKSEVAKPYIDQIIMAADEAINQDSAAFKMSEYLLFSKTGNRTVFQKGYYSRREKCSNLMFAYWLTQDEKYLEPLIDYIMYICDEFSWCLPAHVKYPEVSAKEAIEHIDLFQAETARLLAETVMCVGDKLPKYALDRMEYEIRRRIFATIATKKYDWELSKMNWSVVCGAGCTLAALYFGTDEEKEIYVKRFIGCLDSYLEGIENDGCCKEGISYWTFGFGKFVILAQAVKVYTDGKVDYFKNQKVKTLAMFPQKVRMSHSKVAAISDCNENFSFKIGLASWLKSKYSEFICPELKYGGFRDNVNSVSELLWLDENYQGQPLTHETNYFADSQWYINRKEKFGFVAKGGHNNEPHNHNDIGSFMITVGDETFISDLGSGVYAKETFRAETRYTLVQNSSRGHSVPIVDGKYQSPGSQHCSKNLKMTDNSIEFNIEDAYDTDAVNEIKRSFKIDENKVTLTDIFDFNSEGVSVAERFISKIEPVLCDGYADFGIGRIVYDAKRYTPSVNTESFIKNDFEEVTVYQIDFTPVNKGEKVFEFEFLM